MILDVMFIDRVSGKGNAIGRVRLFLLYSLNQLTFDIDFFSRAFGLWQQLAEDRKSRL